MNEDELYPQQPAEDPSPPDGGSRAYTGSDGHHHHHSSDGHHHHHSSDGHHHHHNSDGHHHHRSSHRRVYQDYGSVVLGSMEDMERGAALAASDPYGSRDGAPHGRYDDDRRDRYDDRRDRYDDRRDRYDDRRDRYDDRLSGNDGRGRRASFSGGYSAGSYRRAASDKKKLILGGIAAVLLVAFILALALLLDPGEPSQKSSSGKFTPESVPQETIIVEDDPNSP